MGDVLESESEDRLHRDPGARHIRILAAAALLLSAMEVAAYTILADSEQAWFLRPVGWAARIWVLMGLAYLALSLWMIVRELGRDVARRRVWPLLAIFLAGGMVLFGLGDVQHAQLNYESCLQAKFGFQFLARSDLGYHLAGFHTYPARQYLVTILPSLLMGRSILALQLGYALPFLLGLLLLYAGLRRQEVRADLAACAVLGIFCSPFVLKFLRWYEQTLLPISFTLQAAGWFLLVLRRASLPRRLALIWIGAMLGTSYTPAMAAWGLLLAICGLLVLDALRQRRISLALAWASTALPVLVFGLCARIAHPGRTLTPREDLLQDLAGLLKEGFGIFLLGEGRAPSEPFFSPVLVFPVLLYLLLALTWRLRTLDLLLAGWTLAVVAVSVTLLGFANPPPSFSLHRAMVVLPVLLAAIVWWSERFLRLHRGRLAPAWGLILIMILGGTALSQYVRQQLYFYQRSPDIRDGILPDLLRHAEEAGLSPYSQVPVMVLSDYYEATNLGDYMAYLVPGAPFYDDRLKPKELDPRLGLRLYIDPDRRIPEHLAVLRHLPVKEVVAVPPGDPPRTIRRIYLPPGTVQQWGAPAVRQEPPRTADRPAESTSSPAPIGPRPP